MKSLKNILFLAIALAMCFGCRNAFDPDTDKKDFPVDSFGEEADEEEVPHFADTLSDERYHQRILEAISEGDKCLFAKMVCYPVRRQYPLHNIENERQMIEYFDTLFDKPFRKRLSQLDSTSWEDMGWKGSMILDGEIWDTRPCVVVNYSSPLEQRYADSLRKKDMARVHPSLRGNWRPFDCYFLDGSAYSDFEYQYARIDVCIGPNAGLEANYRLALFKKGTRPTEAPDVVMTGTSRFEGYMQTESLDFKNDEYEAVVNPYTNQGSPSCFMMCERGEKKWTYIVPCQSNKIQPF